jgi:hypothetical protein
MELKVVVSMAVLERVLPSFKTREKLEALPCGSSVLVLRRQCV